MPFDCNADGKNDKIINVDNFILSFPAYQLECRQHFPSKPFSSVTIQNVMRVLLCQICSEQWNRLKESVGREVQAKKWVNMTQH